eukprot:366486-Chlamydomonas_euryale.AAC.13
MAHSLLAGLARASTPHACMQMLMHHRRGKAGRCKRHAPIVVGQQSHRLCSHSNAIPAVIAMPCHQVNVL